MHTDLPDLGLFADPSVLLFARGRVEKRAQLGLALRFFRLSPPLDLRWAVRVRHTDFHSCAKFFKRILGNDSTCCFVVTTGEIGTHTFEKVR